MKNWLWGWPLSLLKPLLSHPEMSLILGPTMPKVFHYTVSASPPAAHRREAMKMLRLAQSLSSSGTSSAHTHVPAPSESESSLTPKLWALSHLRAFTAA